MGRYTTDFDDGEDFTQFDHWKKHAKSLDEIPDLALFAFAEFFGKKLEFAQECIAADRKFGASEAEARRLWLDMNNGKVIPGCEKELLPEFADD